MKYARNVPIKVAAKVYGKDPAWVRFGILTGYLPIGVATRDGKIATLEGKGRINYYISPLLLYKHTGYLWEGPNEHDN